MGEEGRKEGQYLETTQEETPIGGLQTPKVAIIAERENHLTSPALPLLPALLTHFKFYYSSNACSVDGGRRKPLRQRPW